MTLAPGEHSQQAVEMARQHRDFVFGFIAMERSSTSDREKTVEGGDGGTLTDT